MMANRSDLEVGNVYTSFSDFENDLKRHQDTIGCVFVKIKVKKMKSDSIYRETLIYDELIYGCKQGKRRMPSSSQGKRPNQRTYKIGCTAKIRVVAKETGGVTVLKISTCHLEHNDHPIGQQYVKLLPEKRRRVVKSTPGSILQVSSVSTKDVKDFVTDTKNKIVLNSDIQNLKQEHRQQLNDASAVKLVLDKIANDGGQYRFGSTSEGEFRFLAFSTKEMLDSLKTYPEYLLIDATYKCNFNNYVLLNVLCVDNHGQGRPVFHCFMHNETAEVLSICLNVLGSFFHYQLSKVVFVDKDLSELVELQNIFPHVDVRLCSFHPVSALKKVLQKQKDLPSRQIGCVLNLFKEQRACQCEGDYFAALERLFEICPPPIVDYLQRNWWNCPHLWASHRSPSPFFHITTMNHVEMFHQKFKKIIETKTKLGSCIKDLTDISKDIAETRNNKALINSISHKYNTAHPSPTIDAIRNHLTPFASKIVCYEYTTSQNMEYTIDRQTNDSFNVTANNEHKTYITGPEQCDCRFFSDFGLPCRHIFYIRSFLGMELYSFPISRFQNHLNLSCDAEIKVATNSNSGIVPAHTPNTAEEKFASCRELTKAIDTFLPLLGDSDFNHKLSQFQKLLTLLKENKPVEILDLS